MHNYYLQRAEWKPSSLHGNFHIDSRVVYNGVSQAVDEFGGPAQIMRFACKDTAFAHLSAGEALSNTNEEQFLCYDESSSLFKARVADHIYVDFTLPYKGLKYETNGLWIVDTKELGSIASGGSISAAYRYNPVFPDWLKLNQNENAGPISYFSYNREQFMLEPVVGNIVNQLGTLFVPETPFKAAAATDVGTASTTITGYTGTDAAAEIVIDTATIGSADLEALFETTAGDSTHILVAVDSTNNTAVWGYIRDIAEAGTVYTIDMYNDISGTAQTWLGAAGDKTGSYNTTATEWYIFAISSTDAYATETAYIADDADHAGNLIVSYGQNSGILVLTDALTAGNTYSLFYSVFERWHQPDADWGTIWTPDENWPVKMKNPFHTLALIAGIAESPTISGLFTKD